MIISEYQLHPLNQCSIKIIKMYRIAFFSIFMIPFFITAQISDDFSDGNFTNNPSWAGDVSQFEVNSSKQLHLKSSASDTSYLSTPNSSITNTEWRFWIKQSFNSSDNNHSRIYLDSDSEDLEKPLKGYFVQVGSSDDNISLCSQSGYSITEIIAGSHAFTGNSVNELRIKVTRENNGKWELFCDDSGGENFTTEGSGYDTTHSTTAFFGISCKYTSSNSTKFYFDDFYTGPIVIDTSAPELIIIKVLSQNEIAISFSENLNKISAETLSNYSVDNGIGIPWFASLASDDASVVNLIFATNLPNGIVNSITIRNIEDLHGNILKEAVGIFSFYKEKAYDVVINEIMADPDPPRELPLTEYIELYNRTSVPISLDNWKLEFGSSHKFFPDITIQPHGFLIISKDLSLINYGPVADILTSASSLSNDGTTITLRNQENNIISTLSYSNSWYNNTYKGEGGWSLEQIDPDNPCGGAENWLASVDMEGGTPGRKNSVFAKNPDNSAPELLRIGIISNSCIYIYFSESLDSNTLSLASRYSIDPEITISEETQPLAPEFSSVLLKLNETLSEGTIYHLSIIDTITDCVGNIVQFHSSLPFGLPSSPVFSDVVINEVLFNPSDYLVRGNDFVEIYNRSDKIIDLKDFILSSISPIS